MSNIIIDENVIKMDSIIEKALMEVNKLKTDLAHPAILSEVCVEYYGSKMPVSQVSKIVAVNGRQLFVKPYDKSLIQSICTAILKTDLGLNPQNNGDSIVIPIPQLTEENRLAIIKKLHSIIESYKIAIRNIRRNANQLIKKDSSISENQQQALELKIQQLTDQKIKELTDIYIKKEKQILST